MRNFEHILKKQQNLPVQYASKTEAFVIRDEKCPVYTYLNSFGLGSRSSKTRLYALQAVARHLGKQSIYDIVWNKFDKNTLSILIDILKGEDLSTATIRLYIGTIKRVLREALLLEQISVIQYERIKSVPIPKFSKTKKHSIITPTFFESLLESCEDGTSKGVRDAAIFAIIVGCGLRRFEAAKIQMSDLNLDTAHLSVEGKGGKYREITIHSKIMVFLAKWLDLRGFASGPLFFRFYDGDSIGREAILGQPETYGALKAISHDAIYYLCKKRGLMTDIDHIPPHSLRRAFATWLYNNGANIKNIRDNLGHSSIKTTEGYIINTQEEMDKTIKEKLF